MNVPRVTTRKKRHHQAPRAYLERFARDGKVGVVRRDGGTFDSDPINVAVESGFYDITDGSGQKSDEIEDFLEVVEGAAMGAIASIDRTGRASTEGSRDRDRLALFLGLQMTRTTQPPGAGALL